MMDDGNHGYKDVTSQVYGAIRDGLYSDALVTLQSEIQVVLDYCCYMLPCLWHHKDGTDPTTPTQLFPDNPAALSLLGFCYFHTGHFDDAANVYVAKYHWCTMFTQSTPHSHTQLCNADRTAPHQQRLQIASCTLPIQSRVL